MDLGLKLQSIFPKTLAALSSEGLGRMSSEFSVELYNLVGGPIDQDANWTHWFPAYLKVQKVKAPFLELAEFEYLKHLVIHQNMGRPKLDVGQVQLQPGVQFVFLSQHQSAINKAPGLYCIYLKNKTAEDMLLNQAHALIIDTLHEPRKFNREQLISACELEQPSAKDGLDAAYEYLKGLGILIEGDVVGTLKGQSQKQSQGL